ncbi:DUF2938 family protein [Spirosoma linguale]|uniref:DUF2938 domain-containing protein n=1 Tax=Spirosoma linguale (strain ATCC 33905 / DSM 74 / LMG 10896 / Claus 1) TaxID=504472 RepID=D2QC46_SPILD|nr:conserved hypothetical protein [Spirosoma linguale DSM 74]
MKTAVKIILTGIGGTLATDGWSWMLRLLNIHSHGLPLVGSWIIAHLGNALQLSLAGQELILGWIAHYCLGISFAFLLRFLYGRKWFENPSIAGALVLGLITLIISILLIQPVLGFGIAFSRMPHPGTLVTKVVLFHLVYSLGIFGVANGLKNNRFVSHQQVRL